MPVITGNNATIAIGTTTAAANLSQFEADSYTVIEQVLPGGIPAIGDSSNPVEISLLSSGRVNTAKGIRNAGGGSIVFAFNPGGAAGQDALKAAYEAGQGASEYNFRILLDDQITPSTGNPTARYFRAIVTSYRMDELSSDGIVQMTADILVNSAIVEEAAT